MIWELKSDRPIYAQLMEQIKLSIIAGEYAAGDKLPSIRDLAAQAAVNPNTMQKAFMELEREGLAYSQRTSGRFITEDKEMIDNMRDQLAIKQISEFLGKMEKLGYDQQKTIDLINHIGKESN